MRTRDTADARGTAWSRQIRPERHRDRVLATVRERGFPVSLSELADAFVDQAEPPQPLATRSDVDAERVRARLHHIDLPKLDDRGVIEYDASRNVVSERARSESR